MITSRKAAEVAKEHGLGLSDAAALARLADDETDAHEIAAMFADKAEDVDPAAAIKNLPRL